MPIIKTESLQQQIDELQTDLIINKKKVDEMEKKLQMLLHYQEKLNNTKELFQEIPPEISEAWIQDFHQKKDETE